MSEHAQEPLPVTIIGGYLGAGKTTLVNHLLCHANGVRLAILVNDFGDLPIDADLIEAEDENVISITGGCVCCSFGSDLAGTLNDLAGAKVPPDHILLEASGVALPGALAASISLMPTVRLDGVVVLVDAETVRARAKDRYMGDTITRQLAEADLILLNKCDLVDEERIEGLRTWLGGDFPQAHLVPVTRAQTPLAGLIGQGHVATAASSDQGHAEALFETRAFKLDARTDGNALLQSLTGPRAALMRAKGFIQDEDGRWLTIQIVGRRGEITPAPTKRRNDPPARAELVCIALKGQPDWSWLAQAIRGASITGNDNAA